MPPINTSTAVNGAEGVSSELDKSKHSEHDIRDGGEGVKLPVSHSVAAKVGKAIMHDTSAATAVAPDWKGPQQDGQGSSSNGDPFKKGSPKANYGVKLSGGAHAFDPSGSKPAPIKLLNLDSTADDSPQPVIVSSDKQPKVATDVGGIGIVQQPIGTRGPNFSPTRELVHFTTDVGPGHMSPGGHYMKVVNVPARTLGGCLEALYQGYNWHSKLRGTYSSQNGAGYINVFLNFDDIRDAGTARDDVSMVNPAWNITYISQVEFAGGKKHAQTGTRETTSYHDGQVVFTAEFEGITSDLKTSLDTIFDEVHELAKASGEVLAFTELDVEGGKSQFRAEYFKISVAKKVLEVIQGTILGRWTITSKEMPDYAVETLTRGMEGLTYNAGTPYQAPVNSMAQYTSPTGRTAWNVDEHGNQVPAQAPNILPKTHSVAVGANMSMVHRHSAPDASPPNNMIMSHGGSRSGSWPGSNSTYSNPPVTPPAPRRVHVVTGPHTVDLHKIKAGLDVRTTLMLRNVPNTLTADQFKDILNSVVFGRYDFSYLRYDFAQSKNMGYAFVNFSDVRSLVLFVEAYNGYPWVPSARFNPNHGPRVIEVSYATVQGADCLIEKFRNSSVMKEYSGYIPKLWFTYDNAPAEELIGSEMVFPQANNHTKLMRSIGNAGHVGLYARNRGRGTANGHRQSRSQYDRGTTMQMHEDAQYHQQLNHGIVPFHGGHIYRNANNMMAGPAYMQMMPPAHFPPVAVNNGFPHPAQPYFAHNGALMGTNTFQNVVFGNPFADGAVQRSVNQYSGQIAPHGVPKTIEEDDEQVNVAGSYAGGAHGQNRGLRHN